MHKRSLADFHVSSLFVNAGAGEVLILASQSHVLRVVHSFGVLVLYRITRARSGGTRIASLAGKSQSPTKCAWSERDP